MTDNLTEPFYKAVMNALPDVPQDVMRAWVQNPEVLKEFLSVLVPRQESMKKAFMMITLRAVEVKWTKDCFTKMRYRRYRDPNLDLWLPLEQKARGEGKATVWQVLKGFTFIEVVQSLLKTSETNRKKLSKLLIEGKHTFTLPEIEALIERQEAGENIGLLVNGYANFLFTEDSDGNVSVVRACRDGRRWRVNLYRLGFVNRWSAVNRFFYRN